MNLLLQLLPYAVFAGIAATATAYYVLWTSQRRKTRRTSPRAPTGQPLRDASLIERFSHASRVAAARVSPSAGKTQILRLGELGISEGHIAAALQVPLQEVQIVLNLELVRRSSIPPSMARSENPQPSIVE